MLQFQHDLSKLNVYNCANINIMHNRTQDLVLNASFYSLVLQLNF